MAILLWCCCSLLISEIVLSLARWHGLTILGPRGLPVSVPLLVACVVGLTQIPWTPGATLGGGLLGIGAFLVLAIVRQRTRLPHIALAAGERDGRRIADVAIPIDGGPMPGLLVEPRDGATTGVLIVHGAGDHRMFYAWPRVQVLADAGFAVCAIDVDGHGDNPRVLAFPDVLDDVHAAVAWLRARYDRVAVIGISQGGCIAARAVADGLAVDALVIMEAPITINVTRAVIRREARVLAHPATWALHSDVGTIGLIQGWRTPAQRTRIGTVDLIERLDIVGSVARIRCPLLLCYARADAVVPVEQAHTIAQAMPPHARFMLVPRATHLSLSIDRRVIRRIAAWLHQALDDARAPRR